MEFDGELKLAIQRINDVREQLEEGGYSEELSDLLDRLQMLDHRTRVSYNRTLRRYRDKGADS